MQINCLIVCLKSHEIAKNNQKSIQSPSLNIIIAGLPTNYYNYPNYYSNQTQVIPIIQNSYLNNFSSYQIPQIQNIQPVFQPNFCYHNQFLNSSQKLAKNSKKSKKKKKKIIR